MIGDLAGGLAQLLLPGPLLLLLGLSFTSAFGACCYGWGRRAAFREIDEARFVVRAAVEDAAAPSVVVPLQRDSAE